MCKTRGKCFKNKYDLKSHSRTHRMQYCSKCNFVCTSSVQMNHTMKMKQHNTNLECITCGKCFKENWKLKSHSKTHRLRDCPNCKFVGTSSNQLKQYMKIHNLNQCNLCKKVFSIPATLLNHQKNISCVFACSLCPKLLSDKRHRKESMQVNGSHSLIVIFVASQMLLSSLWKFI